MPSLFEALEAREADARGRAEGLRERIAELSRELAQVEEELSRLRITRETVDQVLADGPAPAGVGRVGDVESVVVPLSELAPVMLRAEEAGDTVVTSQAYRLILVAIAEAAGPLRCKDVCEAVGLGSEPRQVEGMRSKLKRLAERQILVETEPEPGRFTLASRAAAR
ncbi:hypothetical protein [Actinacidiphila paucisporea]|uniref:Uncharacterized protein n=1 Tax=Actinacidiphila paucisporea TaxID=310782 RepID=A0A1M7Q8V5_9ACTN|nr:hypothetical protein [Actinacidiphila paucisporea]SHN26817.1 hypothetical protein SAMN05216499_13059 [Actinacidiphila paucisporea]